MFARITRTHVWGAAVCWVGAAAVVACAATQRGATDANLATANAKAAEGGKLFVQKCASCHGQKGEGVTAPGIIGYGALPEYPRQSSLASNGALNDPSELQLREWSRAGTPKREAFRNAQDVYNYISQRMPLREAGTLRPDEYWAILNFMLAAHGATVPPEGINSSNANKVPIVAP
jgi:mono/diheme cytochrome c family protein